jgi:integrase
MSPLPRYLFRRNGSSNLYLRLQVPGGKVYERSLRTSDPHAAKEAARDEITQHERRMYARRSARAARVVHGPLEYTPGLHPLDGGGHVTATNQQLTFTDANGQITSTRPNGPAIYITGPRLSAAREFKAFDDAYDGVIGEGPIDDKRPKLASKSADDKLLETYIAHNGITGYREKEARDIWHIFRTVLENKPLAKCTRDDGRKIVAHLEDQAGGEIKSATLKRRMVPLIATVNLAIKDGALTFNPFVGCVPDRDDSERRQPFDDDDMKLIRDNLHRLSENDQLLIRVLASTGMRRGEAFEIDQEQTEGGCRFVIVGTKTEASRRRVPFPAELLPYLPAKIAGPLFTGRKDSTTKRLTGFLREIGIVDPTKVAHSFRHRAQDRLRAAGVPEDMRWALLGHEKRTVASGYGKGFPVPMLKEAIDKIGF